MTALTLPMQRVLRTALYRSSDECWQVAREASGAHGRIVRALKDRHLIAWSGTSSCWVLTRQGERARRVLCADELIERFLGGRSWR